MLSTFTAEHSSRSSFVTHARRLRPRYGLAPLALTLLIFSLSACYSALPDMQNVAKPNPEPSAQSGWDLFYPPVSTASAVTGSPMIAEWTRTGVSDDTLAITGDVLSSYTNGDQGKDTQFLLYGQTAFGDCVQAPASIQRLDGLKAAITLPTGLPAWSTYFLWPKNSNGYGYPVGVNRTDAWWIGPCYTKTYVGETVSVYGRNLSHDNGTTSSWVYIKPTGSSGQWVTPTSVNPYRVQFTVPSLSNGTYEVWVHNGHGGSYGWSGPLSLTIADQYSWNGPTYNVTSYGATGNGVDDDAPEIKSATDAAIVYAINNPGSHPTVYFPAGTYMMSHGINVGGSNVRLLGAGMNSTYIACHADFAVSGVRKLGLIYGQGGPFNNLEIRDMTLDSNGYFPTGDGWTDLLLYLGWTSTSTDYTLTNVRIQCLQSNKMCMRISSAQRIKMTGCEFIGGYSHLLTTNQVAIDSCDFYGSNDHLMSIYAYGTDNFSLTNCTGQDYDINSSTGQSLGRFLTGNCLWGTQSNFYIGNNTTTDLAPRSGAPDQNSGEQIMNEGTVTIYQGTPSSATSTTVTFSNLTTDCTGKTAIIIDGKGVGQYRDITGYSSGTITVSPAWTVIPDSTSTVIAQYATSKWAIYSNVLDGKNDYATRSTASTSWAPFGGGYEWIADNNLVTDMRDAWAITCVQQYSGVANAPINGIQPSYFNYFTNNTIDGCQRAMRTSSGVPSGTTAYPPGMICNVYRDNTVTDVAETGVFQYCDQVTPTGYRYDMEVYEHNSFTNLPKAFNTDYNSMGTRSKSTVLYKNTFSLGTATYSGSFGFSGGTNMQVPGLRTNTWTGFASTYTGTLPGALLEIPVRNCNVVGTSGGSSQTTDVTIWNSGTSSLSWTATSDQTWLTTTSSSGSIADENSSSTITLNCNPSSLSAGTYTGTITVTGASQTKKIVVTFIVSPALPSGNMALWLKADAGVTKDGSNMVSAWADQSGSGNNVAPYYTYRAEWVADAINDHPALYFDGGCDNYFKTLSTGLTGTITMFAVCGSPISQVEGTTGNRIVSCPPTGTSGWDCNVALFNGCATPFAPTIKYDSFALNSGQSIAVLGIGTMFQANGNCSGSEAVTGYIPEVIIYNRALTAQETADVKTYLANKYGITDTNTPPTVSLTSPTEGTHYTSSPATVSIAATASDSDGTVSQVIFYNGYSGLSTDTSSPYSYDWTNVAAGRYTLTAKAKDNSGVYTTSAAVNILVDTPPTVSITAPTGGSSYTAPATINITASPADADGTISKVEFYNNGILLGTDTDSAGGWTYSWANVAASGSNGISLTAKAFDNFDVATTSSAVTCTVTDTNLKCYWKLDENTGTSAADSSGTGNTGTLTNSPTWTTGKVSYGVSFDGTNDYIIRSSASSLPMANATQTISCWIYVASTPTARKTAVCATNATQTGYGSFIGYRSATEFGVWRYNGTAVVTTTTLPTAGYWHHVAYVVNGSNKYLYIDGSQAATSTATLDTMAQLRINAGRSAAGTDYWAGKVDEVRIYNRALSSTEISALALGKQ